MFFLNLVLEELFKILSHTSALVSRLRSLDSSHKESQNKNMNRPPPYFPQNQLSPPSTKKYRNFKLTVAAILFVLVLIVVAAGYGVYYLISALMN